MSLGFGMEQLISYIIRPWANRCVFVLLFMQDKDSWCELFVDSGGWLFRDWWNGTYLDVARLALVHTLPISLLRLLDKAYIEGNHTFSDLLFMVVVVGSRAWVWFRLLSDESIRTAEGAYVSRRRFCFRLVISRWGVEDNLLVELLLLPGEWHSFDYIIMGQLSWPLRIIK